MNADEYAISLLVCDRGAIPQRDMAIVTPREQDSHAVKLQESFRAMRHIEGELFFRDTGFQRSGILAPVTGIEHDETEGLLAGYRRRIGPEC
jgi:hypothetical protein